MSAFNILQSQGLCPHCGANGPFEIQFKYGDTWQHAYSLGESLRWGGNDVGEPGHERVRVEGIGGPCVKCGEEFLEFDIIVENDRITAVHPVGVHREDPSPEGFVVEEP